MGVRFTQMTVPSLLALSLLFCGGCARSEASLPEADPSSEWNAGQQLFQKPSVRRQDLTTLAAHMNADRVAKALRSLVNQQLGVPAMQAIFDGLTFERVPINFTDIVNDLALSLDQTISVYTQALERSRQTVKKYYDQNPVDMHVFRQFKECCRLTPSHLSYRAQFGAYVNTTFSCDVVSPTESTFLFYPGNNLTAAYRHHSHQLRAMRWQYFISPEGSHIEHPAHSFDSNVANCLRIESQRHRAQFIASALPYAKHVVLVLEYGSTVSESQLRKVKSVAKLLLKSFSPQDRVTIVAVADKMSVPCDGKLLPATWETKTELDAFIDSLTKEKLRTNHSLGFEEAFRLLDEAKDNYDYHSFILYISRGLLSSIGEASKVLALIAQASVDTNLNVQINTFPVIDQYKNMLWETQFLQTVANQDFKVYEHFLSDELKLQLKQRAHAAPIGKMIVVKESENQVLTLKKMFESLKKPEASLNPAYRSGIQWSEPHLDPVAQRASPPGVRSNLLVSMSTPVWQKDHFIGLVGQDISLETILAILRYYVLPDVGENYAFLMDLDGAIIEHPRYNGRVPWLASLPEVEDWSAKSHVTADILVRRMTDEEKTGMTSIWASRMGQSVKITYFWTRLKNAPYVAVVASVGTLLRDDLPRLNNAKIERARDLTYHRLDLLLNQDIKHYCLNLKQLSSTERGGVYLGAGSFQRPYRHLLSAPESKMAAAGYWAHVGDLSGLIPNTGLKPNVKQDIAALAGIVPEWKRLFKDSKYRKYIVRRFAATPTGAMVTFPAALMHSSYDPTHRDWFRRALEYPGKIVLSAPYLDPSGAGYVVTLSHTIYEGKAAAMHSLQDRVVAVVGMDVPVAFLYKLIIDTLPLCKQMGKRCVMFEDRGYLLARGDPLLSGGQNASEQTTTVTEREPLEGQHLTHQEPHLAVTLLQYPKVMRKRLCLRYGDRTVQRQYSFNMSMADALTVPGREAKGCARYELSAVPGTNAFLVTQDTRCQQRAVKSAFCPCSVSDRRCLLCTRMDPIECECPCECPVDRPPWVKEMCSQDSDEQQQSMESCSSGQSPLLVPDLDAQVLGELALNSRTIDHQSELSMQEREDQFQQQQDMLPQCVSIRCEQFKTFEQCVGLIGCQWCLRQEDGKHHLDKAFCSPIASCFGGIKGRYLDGETAFSDPAMSIATPVGPVAGAIMGVFVLLVIGVYCYRHQVTRLVESRASSGSGARLHLAVCDEDEQEFQFDHDGSKPSGNDNKAVTGDVKTSAVNSLLLASFERDTIPRAPAPQWRQGPRTESSDHGYSTMTDRNCDDSERGTAIEPLTPSSGRMKQFTLAPVDDACSKLLPSGETQLKEQTDESFCEPTTVTIEAQVHAIDAVG